MIKIIVDYLKLNHKDLPKLFGLLKAFKWRQAYNYSFLNSFFKYYIHAEYSVDSKRDIFNYFLNFCDNPDIPEQTKVHASYIIIYPMLQQSPELHKQIVDSNTIAHLFAQVKSTF